MDELPPYDVWEKQTVVSHEVTIHSEHFCARKTLRPLFEFEAQDAVAERALEAFVGRTPSLTEHKNTLAGHDETEARMILRSLESEYRRIWGNLAAKLVGEHPTSEKKSTKG